MWRFQNIPQAFNAYSYVANNPIIKIDPTGEFEIWGYDVNGYQLTLGLVQSSIAAVETALGAAAIAAGTTGEYGGMAAAPATGGTSLGVTALGVGVTAAGAAAVTDGVTNLSKGTENISKSITKKSSTSTGSTEKSAAEKIDDLSDMPFDEAAKKLNDNGFEYKGKTEGGYDKFYHPDGSRIQVRPNGEVTRNGPKINSEDGSKFRPRIDQNGNRTDNHNTGEIIRRSSN